MKHRKLRIAWSVAWGALAVLLVGLWVRSYYYLDTFSEPLSITCGVDLHSIKGQLHCSLDKLNASVPVEDVDWGLDSSDAESGYALSQYNDDGSWDFVYSGFDYWTIIAPHWLAAMLCVVCAAIPWSFIAVSRLPWSKRYSLRTLLIATTLVAVGLGLIVWLAR
jgi:hypothetical protein